MNNSTNRLVLGVGFLVLAACQPAEPPPALDPAPEVQSADLAAVYSAAIDHEDRFDADKDRDSDRRPADILAFFEIEPGMSVLDMFSGGGYYSELLSRVVGPQGRVAAHSNEAYAAYVGDEVLNRFSGDRLPNVSILMAENNELLLQPNGFDAVMLVLSYHDIYLVDEANGWPKIDGPAFLAELYKGLKPGGVLGIIDHFASPGAPRETGGTVHRIDPAIVVEEVESAGFLLEETSDVLRNFDDDHTLNMADPAIRGKTDRFVMRFRKPSD